MTVITKHLFSVLHLKRFTFLSSKDICGTERKYTFVDIHLNVICVDTVRLCRLRYLCFKLYLKKTILHVLFSLWSKINW